ncbi:MAG: heparinase II/III family protein [Caldilineaceae bacterium]|nr:heparinase II/III family protein [Caldilineaceae bacterium]
MSSPFSPSPWVYSRLALGYDTSIFELSEQVRPGLHRWSPDDLKATLAARAAWEKAQRELHVYYYRINHLMAFPLPLNSRPNAMPAGIPQLKWYPWLIWLAWALEERWGTLHCAWRHLGDGEAGRLLQTELAALDGWYSFRNWNHEVGLPTAHLSGCLARFLANHEAWDIDLWQRAFAAALRLVEKDVWPWFQTTWQGSRPLAPHDIHNIPVIALVRGAQLARFVDSPHVDTDAMEARTKGALRAWWRHRRDPAAPHTEGVSYDGFLMDSFTDWLDGLPDREALLAEGRDAFAGLIRQWVYSTLPGRPDLHAPLGDVEGEMPFWISCMLRLAGWYGPDADFDAGLWLAQRMDPVRLPAAALTWALDHTPAAAADAAPPVAAPQEVANAATLRTGWDSADLLALVGMSRSGMSHLHNDGGQLILGWHNRFWITDPGYQQYRPGEERDFSIGVAAHNAPVIGGIAQSRRDLRLLHLQGDGYGRQQVALDLTGCYEGLPQGARVRRDVWLIPPDAEGSPLVIVRDTLAGLAPGTEIRTHWQGGAQLAWAFVDGWARLSDGQRALWVGAWPPHEGPAGMERAISAAMLQRHPGSRGPLTLVHAAPLPDTGVRWWVFRGDLSLRWTAPRLDAEVIRRYAEL